MVLTPSSQNSRELAVVHSYGATRVKLFGGTHVYPRFATSLLFRILTFKKGLFFYQDGRGFPDNFFLSVRITFDNLPSGA